MLCFGTVKFRVPTRADFCGDAPDLAGWLAGCRPTVGSWLTLLHQTDSSVASTLHSDTGDNNAWLFCMNCIALVVYTGSCPC